MLTQQSLAAQGEPLGMEVLELDDRNYTFLKCDSVLLGAPENFMWLIFARYQPRWSKCN